MNLSLIRGGQPISNFPACDSSIFYGEPNAKTVSRVHNVGRYTQGITFEPTVMKPQADALFNADVQVNEHVYMYVVPAEHVISNLQFAVRRGDALMSGATVKPYAVLVDDAGTETVLDIFDSLPAVTLTASSVNYAQLETPYYVATGKSLVIGFTLVSAPTQAGVKFARFSGRIQLASTVDGLAVPDAM